MRFATGLTWPSLVEEKGLEPWPSAFRMKRPTAHRILGLRAVRRIANAQHRPVACVITWRADHFARHGPSPAATAKIPGFQSIQ